MENNLFSKDDAQLAPVCVVMNPSAQQRCEIKVACKVTKPFDTGLQKTFHHMYGVSPGSGES